MRMAKNGTCLEYPMSFSSWISHGFPMDFGDKQPAELPWVKPWVKPIWLWVKVQWKIMTPGPRLGMVSQFIAAILKWCWLGDGLWTCFTHIAAHRWYHNIYTSIFYPHSYHIISPIMNPSTLWRFPKIGVPRNHPFCFWDFAL